MIGEVLFHLKAVGSRRLAACLLVVLGSTHVAPAAAQTAADWRKSQPPPQPAAPGPLTQTAPIRPLSTLEDTVILLPLIFYPVQADLPVILNGNFEQGRNGDWNEAWVQVDFIITNTDLPLDPNSGEWIAWLGGVDNEDNHLWQSVGLPPGQSAYLNFYYQTHSDESNCNNDRANLTVNNLARYTFTLCEAANTSAWQPVTINLSSFAGQTAVISFNLTSNGSTWSSVVIDDVSLSSTP
jgi:hypothetical protein